MKKILLLAFALMAISFSSRADEGELFTVSSVDYVIMNEEDMTCYVYGGASSLTKLEFPERVSYNGNQYTVVAINAGAFAENTSITEVIMPNTITDIGMQAFYGCSNLRYVKLSESLRDLPYGLFYMCTSLQSITIPEGVTELGDFCFIMCRSLGAVDLPSKLIVIGDSCFNYCTALSMIELPSSVQKIGSTAFAYCPFTEFVIPKSLEEIGDNPFTGNQLLEKIEVEKGCYSYTAVDGVLYDIDMTKLVAYPLGCTDDEFTVPEGVTDIAQYCFSESKYLETVTLPSTTKYIGERAFAESTSLTKVYCAAVTPPEVVGKTFLRCLSDLVLYVPRQSLKAYEEAPICTDTDLPKVEGYDAPVAKTTVIVEKTAEIEDGKTLQLTANIILAEGATMVSKGWTSSDEAVATVDENGLVTAVAPGTAVITITITDSEGTEAKAKCEITVKEAEGVLTINVDDQDVEIYTLQGVKINTGVELPSGFYIIRKGSQTRKVMVK